jgi:hypothetical protein
MKHVTIAAAALCAGGAMAGPSNALAFEEGVVTVTRQTLTQISVQSLPALPGVGGCVAGCTMSSGNLKIVNSLSNQSYTVNNVSSGSNVVQGGQISISIVTAGAAVTTGAAGPR